MKKEIPLAHLLRPATLDEFIGQEQLIGRGKPLRNLIESGKINSSIILWGPPGCGKTTIARLIAKYTGKQFTELSAVSAGKKDIQNVVNKSRLFNERVILFLDEIHRFNKAQQDFLLPYIERGNLLLIGATTENPSFEIISALMSRSTIFVLNQLSKEDIKKIIERAIEKGFENKLEISEEDKELISRLSNGDARTSLNILELSYSLSKDNKVTKEIILEAVQKTHLRYDKNGEEHYNIISALHKSIRDSDIDASIYWTMRLIEAREDPKYIIRRMIRFASEDIGNADPMALQIATSAKQAVEFLGYPECDTALIQTAIYLAKAKKDNSCYKAVNLARRDIQNTGNLPVPLHLRNAETKLMKDLGYGKGYKYAHDFPDAKVEQEHMPEELKGRKYYFEE